MQQKHQEEIADEVSRAQDAGAIEPCGDAREGEVVLQRVGGEPVVGKQAWVVEAESVDQIDGVIALTELIAAECQRERDAEDKRAEGGDDPARSAICIVGCFHVLGGQSIQLWPRRV